MFVGTFEPTRPPLIKASTDDSSAWGAVCGRPGLHRETGTFLTVESRNKGALTEINPPAGIRCYRFTLPLIHLFPVLLEAPVKQENRRDF